MKQWWMARWSMAGVNFEYRFPSLRSRIIAHIDLELKLIDLGYSVPDNVLLEEIEPVPLERRLEWMYPIILSSSSTIIM